MKITTKNVKAASGNNKYLFICLHGYGASANNFMPTAMKIQSEFPDAYLSVLNAPYQIENRPNSFMWFDLYHLDEERTAEEICKSTNALLKYINQLSLKLNISWHRIVICGFSQGAMMAIHVALRLPHNIAAVISFAGQVIEPHLLEKEIVSRPNIFLMHGDADNVVPYSSMKESLLILGKYNINVKTSTLKKVAHTISANAIAEAVEFLDVQLK